DCSHVMLLDRRLDQARVCCELGPPHRMVGRGDRTRYVGQRHADGPGADIEAEQARLAGQQGWEVFDRYQRCYSHERRIKGLDACRLPGSAIPVSASTSEPATS